MDTLAHAEIALIIDRGVRKVRVNMFKDGKIIGFLKPLSAFTQHGPGSDLFTHV